MDGSFARRAGLRALLAAGALTTALGLTELILAAAGRDAAAPPIPVDLPGVAMGVEPFARHDDRLLFAGVPHARTYPWYEIDALGFRNPPYAERKPPGVFRVVVTGDSTTFGLGVVEERRWSSVLRSALAALAAGDVATEVVNVALVGYSTWQNRVQIERDLPRLQPDVVVVLVTGANDATRVEGATDAELADSAWYRWPFRTRVARLFGLSSRGWAVIPGSAAPGSPTATPRVPPEAAGRNLRAMADRLPGRLVFGLFPPHPTFPRIDTSTAVVAHAARVAAERGVPLADLRPLLDELMPWPPYSDGVHPTPDGHVLIARAVLAEILPRLPVEPARRAWIDAACAVLDGQAGVQGGRLRRSGAPPRYRELLALTEDAARLDAGLDRDAAAGHPSLPDVVREWDPLLGRRSRARSLARLVLADAPEAARDELRTWVRPQDALVAAFGSEAALRAAAPAALAEARALLIFLAEAGLPPLRFDRRRGLAADAPAVAEAGQWLADVLRLEPHDEPARLQWALRLRGAGRAAESRAQFEILAAGREPEADLARGLLALERDDVAAAESALRAAIAAAPSLGYAHFLLARLCLAQDRLDEATFSFALAATTLGAIDGFAGILHEIEARRAELRAAARDG